MKKKLGAKSVIYPIPTVLVGTEVAGKANYTLTGDCGIMGLQPALVYIALHESSYTSEGIRRNNSFSLNFPTSKMMQIADYCGIHSGREVDKSLLFDIFYGELGNVPLIEECPVNLECRVLQNIVIQQRHIYIAEVVQTYVKDDLVINRDGHFYLANMTRLDPLIYSLDNRYYQIAESIGIGYSEGKKFQTPTA
ncbi:MAG: flavin reductase family protein [Candidatus Cloacimonetes bacterium]|nr:flavin reductase family protein [Candidatus Cloacimonadota bacterium]